MFARFRPAVRRRTFVAVATILVGVVLGVTSHAQQPTSPQQPPPQQPPAQPTPAQPTPPQQPPAGQPAPAQTAPAAPAQPGLGFSADAGLVLFTIKAEGAADFDAFFAKVKEALAKGTKPEYKQIAAGWKMYKVTDGAAPGQALYASVIDPAVKDADYDPVKILSTELPADAQALYPKLKDAIISINKLNLASSLKMGGM
jgi:hypothetical protein